MVKAAMGLLECMRAAGFTTVRMHVMPTVSNYVHEFSYQTRIELCVAC